MAVREKVQTSELYTATLNELRDKNKEIEELELEKEALCDRCNDQEEQINDLQSRIEHMGGTVNNLSNVKGDLEQNNDQLKEDTAKAITDRKEAAAAIIKLDEARVLLNKLLGNQGPFSMAQRHKFLNGGKDAEFAAYEETDGSRKGPTQNGD